MGIKIEFNPELALRNYAEFTAGRRQKEECIPCQIEAGREYDFLKDEQRNFWMVGEIPLIETRGSGVISRPIASVKILEVTHFLSGKLVFTKGKYRVVEVFNDDKIHFEGTDRVGERYTAE